jgi:hypothetical protein
MDEILVKSTVSHLSDGAPRLAQSTHDAEAADGFFQDSLT